MANEGDSREYGEEDTETFFTDEIRIADLAEEMNVTDILYTDEAQLGRLKVTSSRTKTSRDMRSTIEVRK